MIVGIWGATRGTLPLFAERTEGLAQALDEAGRSTQPGFVNRNGQLVLRSAEQQLYELCCSYCGQRYGTTGSDIFQRRCPSCQDGAPGLPLA